MRGLADRCLAHAPRDGGNPTVVPGLSVYRRDAPAPPASAVYGRSVFLVVQGRKQARVGDDAYVYDPDHYLVTSVPLPVLSEILVASADRPFLSLAVDFELQAVRELLTLAGDALSASALSASALSASALSASALSASAAEPPQRGLASCPVTDALRDIAGRIVDLLDRPEDAPVLGPLYRRELLYHVLKGPRGGFLRAVAMGHGQQGAVAEVLTAIHIDCTQSFTVPALAAMAGMSETVFYEAFKAVTAASPMQYIKRLRLQEAHRQLSLGLTNVSGAAYGVGYNSLSQFSREFTRVFGENPSACLPR